MIPRSTCLDVCVCVCLISRTGLSGSIANTQLTFALVLLDPEGPFGLGFFFKPLGRLNF